MQQLNSWHPSTEYIEMCICVLKSSTKMSLLIDKIMIMDSGISSSKKKNLFALYIKFKSHSTSIRLLFTIRLLAIFSIQIVKKTKRKLERN